MLLQILGGILILMVNHPTVGGCKKSMRFCRKIRNLQKTWAIKIIKIHKVISSTVILIAFGRMDL